MIERVHNQNFNHLAKVTAVEKVTPARESEEALTKPDQQQSRNSYEVDKEKMEEVVKGMNDFLNPVNTSIKFVLHDKLNDYYVTVVDDKTQEVIKEIPSKKLLDTYANMMEFVGLLVDKKI
ncbi:flagellar protein FlaG [Niallia sp. Krafla_26]|uniref:flagellar protein FlaG n=1 Tax=Niallia sp. Krafla_26 TaxID=3064703 RepID=UPI003D17E511